MDLKGSQKIAVLLLALGDKFTADVFKRLDRPGNYRHFQGHCGFASRSPRGG